MKKKLEGELISIAHRVLQLKNRSETVLLQREAKKLYEQLTVLRFYEENFDTLKSDISQVQLEEKLDQMNLLDPVEIKDLAEKVAEIEQLEVIEEIILETKEELREVTVAPIENEEQVIVAEESAQQVMDNQEVVQQLFEVPRPEVYTSTKDSNKIVSEMPNKKNLSDEIPVTVDKLKKVKSNAPQQISFEDLLGDSYKEPDFVRVEDTPKEVELVADLVFEKKEEIEDLSKKEIEQAAAVILDIAKELPTIEKKEEISFSSTKNTENQEIKSKSLNDRLTSGISFGLNDRIAFEKKLFGESTDDFNRVISQLNTFDSFDEASSFIRDFVKPDYNNWAGQEEYETRFLEIIEKKFN
jgi:hypothetical protein